MKVNSDRKFMMLSRGERLKPQPLVVFLDEYILNQETKGGDLIEWASVDMLLLRNILRIIKVVPLLAGTDAKSSNFVEGEYGTSSRAGEEENIWATNSSALVQNTYNNVVRGFIN